MPRRLAKLRPDTLDAADALATRHRRSRPDVIEAALQLATVEGELFFRALDAVAPLQALRGTGRRARRAAEREAAEEKSEIDRGTVDRKSTSGYR